MRQVGLNTRANALRPSLVITLATLTLLACVPEAVAADTWSSPHPGMRKLYRTASGPNRIHALEVDLCKAGVGVRTTKSNERQRTPSSFGSLVGAEAVINGDFFNYSGYSTSGLAIGEGQHWSGSSDGAANTYVAFGKNRVEFSGSNESRGAESWMRSVTSGLGVLVEDGQSITTNPSRPSHCSQRHPRTAMGISADKRTLYMAVVDGRSTSSRGMTCVELANVMKGLGAHSAVNLDGGGSSAMWVRGSGVVNNPSDGSQRVVANHLAVFAKGAGEPNACDRSYEEAALQSAARGASTTTDVDGDGIADACSLGPNGLECYLAAGGFTTRVQGPNMPLNQGWNNPKNYASIRYGDLNGDGKADVCARYNAGVRCYLSDGSSFGSRFDGPELSDDSGWGGSASYYSTLAMADINGDGKDDLCARGAAGLYCYYSTGSGFSGRSTVLSELSNGEGFRAPEYYGTIRFGDVNGDGKADVCARTKDGMRCWLSDGQNFSTEISGPGWSDAGGWHKLPYWPTIRLKDVDGDGKADLCARGGSGFRCHLSRGTSFGPALGSDLWPNASGWDDHDNFSTIRMADIDGDGQLDVCARANAKIVCHRFEGDGFGPTISGPPWSNDGDWNRIKYYSTIRVADVDGDGKADLCARGYSRFSCATAPFDGSDTDLQGPPWSEGEGWGEPALYSTIQVVDPPPREEEEEPEPGEDAGFPGDAGDSPDAGAPADAGGPDDTQSVDSDADAPGNPADAISGQDVGSDIGADPDAQDDTIDRPKTASTSGCACNQSDAAPGEAGLLALLAAAVLWRRRR
ncbi:phosphodiester glycosidase family protein [Bradymonas sediminis]|uniref:Uncharacterized protein n=1 Tax=Bradymonas sediminis TaxID=1548548 RepID=A0A2Z4FK68_9DELT|nr:phosphodiester glycosidase family protein [Bradymonas sediminis]AWV89074.1 hypothetical protein DN745_06890 [Bradymonas sediminis]TDP64462.1 MYXO-CTERM domain-containing protein [Bradymonas sediminis]